jgi:hypothetical protein
MMWIIAYCHSFNQREMWSTDEYWKKYNPMIHASIVFKSRELTRFLRSIILKQHVLNVVDHIFSRLNLWRISPSVLEDFEAWYGMHKWEFCTILSKQFKEESGFQRGLIDFSRKAYKDIGQSRYKAKWKQKVGWDKR